MRAQLTRLLILIATVALLAACGGAASPAPTASSSAPADSPSAAPTDTAEPTEAAEPSGSDLDLEGAAGAIDDLDTFQLDVEVHGFVPSASGESGVVMTMVVDRANDGVEMTMSGIEGMPTTGQGLKVLVIGDDAWIDPGTGAYIKQAGQGGNFAGIADELSPATLLATVPAGAFGSLDRVGEEEKNGVASTHYHLDSSVPGFAESLGEDAEADIWIANDGNYLVSMTMTGASDVDGESVDVSMRFDVSRVNDPSISIQAPN